jgi:hypothetical protein
MRDPQISSLLRQSWKADCFAGTATASLGLLLSILPHLIAWQRTGRLEWFADHDDFSFYMLLGSQAYHNHPTCLSDPTYPQYRETVFSSIQSAPGVSLAWALNLGPISINFVWRMLGGVAAGLLWYILIRLWVPRAWVAAALTALLLTDAGLVEGTLFYTHAKMIGMLLAAQAPQPLSLLPQWRILNPSLSLPWLLLYLWLAARAVSDPTPLRRLLAGLAFGMLFHVYFYLWTAAVLGLLVSLVLDPKHLRTYVSLGVIGLMVGAPALWQTWALRRSWGTEWMLRQDKFLPIGHFSELMIPRIALVLLVICLIAVWWRRRDLAGLAGVATGGFVLINQQIVSGLQIENFHWKFAYGPVQSLLLVLLLRDFCSSGSPWALLARAAAWVAIPGVVLSGFGLRVLESTRPGESNQIAKVVRCYHEQRPEGRISPLSSNAVVAGDQDFIEAASIIENTRPLEGFAVLLSGNVDNAEWDARAALNGWLRGLTRDEFCREQEAWLEKNVWGPWGQGRSVAARDERFRLRMASWDTVSNDPEASLERFRVHYVALPSTAPIDHLKAGWRRVQDGPHWRVLERTDSCADARTNRRSND